MTEGIGQDAFALAYRATESATPKHFSSALAWRTLDRARIWTNFGHSWRYRQTFQYTVFYFFAVALKVTILSHSSDLIQVC